MKVHISYNKLKIVIILPKLFFCSRLSAVILSRNLKKAGIGVSGRSIYSSLKQMKNEIKNYKNLTVLNMQSAGGFKLFLVL